MAHKELAARMADHARLSGPDKDVVVIQNPSTGKAENYALVNPAIAYTIRDIQQGETCIDFTRPLDPNVILTNLTAQNRLFVSDTVFLIKMILIEPCRMMSEVEAAFFKTAQMTVTISNSQIEPLDVTPYLSTRLVNGGIDQQGGFAANPTSLVQPGTGANNDHRGFPTIPINGNERVQIQIITDIAGGFRVNRANPFSAVQADGLPVKVSVQAIQAWPIGSRQENSGLMPGIPQPAREASSQLTGRNGGGR